MGVNLGCKIEFSWEFLNGPPLSDLEGFFGHKCDGEALR